MPTPLRDDHGRPRAGSPAGERFRPQILCPPASFPGACLAPYRTPLPNSPLRFPCLALDLRRLTGARPFAVRGRAKQMS